MSRQSVTSVSFRGSRKAPGTSALWPQACAARVVGSKTLPWPSAAIQTSHGMPSTCVGRYGLDGASVVITGAAGGIGRALVDAFVAQGCSVYALDRVAFPSPPDNVHALVADLSSDAAVDAVVTELKERLGPEGHVACLLNNAGQEYETPVDASEPDACSRFATLLDNNVTSMFRLTRALLPLMRPGASIINQSSSACASSFFQLFFSLPPPPLSFFHFHFTFYFCAPV